MREINLTSKEIKVLTLRHIVCREQKECDRIKAILLRHKGWSLAKVAEALLIHEKALNVILMITSIIANLSLKVEAQIVI
jgi:transcriptional regulator